tara:strand:- start:3413 stop:3733 length:321 start_codon:yes stop_codon:yes gene_type:complete
MTTSTFSFIVSYIMLGAYFFFVSKERDEIGAVKYHIFSYLKITGQDVSRVAESPESFKELLYEMREDDREEAQRAIAVAVLRSESKANKNFCFWFSVCTHILGWVS